MITVVKLYQGKKMFHHGTEMISRKEMFYHGSKMISSRAVARKK